MTPTEELRAKLDELGVEYDTYDLPNGEHGVSWIDGNGIEWEAVQQGENYEIHALQLVTPEQAVAATVGKGKAKAHPWGYESDTGFFDMTRCECGETNDISARYCNQCGREIQLDMSVIEYAEDWYTPRHVCKVNADGTLTSLRNGKTYVDAATVGAVPETKYLMALDEAREAQSKLEMCQTSQRVYQSKCRSLKETNADLRRIINDMRAATVGNAGYGIEFAHTFDRPPETMVGETVFDGEGNAIGWIVNATADTCKGEIEP